MHPASSADCQVITIYLSTNLQQSYCLLINNSIFVFAYLYSILEFTFFLNEFD